MLILSRLKTYPSCLCFCTVWLGDGSHVITLTLSPVFQLREKQPIGCQLWDVVRSCGTRAGGWKNEDISSSRNRKMVVSVVAMASHSSNNSSRQ